MLLVQTLCEMQTSIWLIAIDVAYLIVIDNLHDNFKNKTFTSTVWLTLVKILRCWAHKYLFFSFNILVLIVRHKNLTQSFYFANSFWRVCQRKTVIYRNVGNNHAIQMHERLVWHKRRYICIHSNNIRLEEKISWGPRKVPRVLNSDFVKRFWGEKN